jgi:hypothetical protein
MKSDPNLIVGEVRNDLQWWFVVDPAGEQVGLESRAVSA